MPHLPRSLSELIESLVANQNPLTVAQATLTIQRLKASNPLTVLPKLLRITVNPILTDPQKWETDARYSTEEFMSFIPETYASDLPAFEIKLKPLMGKKLGSYDPSTQILTLTADPDKNRFRTTVFHELAHWVHLEGQNRLEVYRRKIKEQFDLRTQGEATAPLPNYKNAVGKKDLFWDPYMGRQYPGTVDGCEIPAMTFELLNKPFMFAAKWNNFTHRETLDIVFSVLFP